MAHEDVPCACILEDGADFAVEDAACSGSGLAYVVGAFVVELDVLEAWDVVGAEASGYHVLPGEGDGEASLVELEASAELLLLWSEPRCGGWGLGLGGGCGGLGSVAFGLLLGALGGSAGGGFGFTSCFGFGAFACLLYLVGYGLVYLAVEVGELALLLADLLAETFLALFEAFDLFLFGYLLLVELLALVHDFADECDHASLGFEVFVLGLHEFALFLHDLLRHVVLVGGVLACVACAAIHLGEVACAEYEDDGGLDFGGLTGYA